MPKVYGRKLQSAPAQVQSLWPTWCRRIFQALDDIPWVSLTAISTLAGVLILFVYFRSIDYFPSDFSALISLGAAASVCAIGLLAALSFGLFAPSFIHRHYSSKNSSLGVPVPVTEREMIALQVLGGASWALWIGYPYARDCGDFLTGFLIAGVPPFVFGAFIACKLIARKGSLHERVARSWVSIVVSTAGVALLIILLPLTRLLNLPGVLLIVLLVMFWGVAIFMNARVGGKIHPIGIAVIGMIVIGYLYIIAPIATNQPAFFPTMVATKLGVRSDEHVRLLVSKQACEFVKDLQRKERSTQPLVCAEGSANEISVAILSNVGERWLVEMNVMNGAVDATPKLRFILPRADAQVLRVILQEPAASKTICRS
jgi:hypothetical protein